MSEIALNAGDNVTGEVIEDLQNVDVSADKMGKISALKTETGDSPAVEVDVATGDANHVDKPEHHNGAAQNGNKTPEETEVTNSGDATKPTVNSEVATETTEENSVKPSVTEESSNLADEAKSKEQSGNETTTVTSEPGVVSDNETREKSTEDGSTETPCDTTESTSATSTTSETTVPTNSESAVSPVKDVPEKGQTEDDEVTIKKQMEALKVESESTKACSPAKKSCSPF